MNRASHLGFIILTQGVRIMKDRRLWMCLPAFLLVVLTACTTGPVETARANRAQEPAAASDPQALELVFLYGSEKEDWIKEVTAAFNQSNPKVGGKTVVVKATPMGSGECIEEVLTGRRKAHLISPASNAFLVLANAEAQGKGEKPVVGKTRNLVLSPVVIAMWKPMAEALGWPNKPVGWANLKALAENKEGWASLKYPQWGQFKFGHTHPDFSNSGLITVLAEAYAGAGKTEGLTVEDVNKPQTGQFMSALERAVVHYGSSTGFFGKKMFANGPEYLSAAVLYENMVIESYLPKYKLPFPVVAIYPKEGTFWSDHPAGIVEREWVTPEHREAAQKYIDFLMAKPQQEKAHEVWLPARPGKLAGDGPDRRRPRRQPPGAQDRIATAAGRGDPGRPETLAGQQEESPGGGGLRHLGKHAVRRQDAQRQGGCQTTSQHAPGWR